MYMESSCVPALSLLPCSVPAGALAAKLLQQCTYSSSLAACRWKPIKTNEGELIPCQADTLKFSDGVSCGGQVLLRMPVVLEHVIEDESPLASWRQGTSSMMMDAEFDIVVTVSCMVPCSAAQLCLVHGCRIVTVHHA